jgi:hypothetical protein
MRLTSDFCILTTRQRDPVGLGHKQSGLARIGRARETVERRTDRRHRIRVSKGHSFLRSK